MSTERSKSGGKLLDKAATREVLMLSGFYLLAFEVLKTQIIDGLKDWIVWHTEPTPERVESLRKAFGDEVVQGEIARYEEQVARYKAEVGIKLNEREFKGLIPSANWLKNAGVLTDEDIADLQKIREHRNDLAHKPHNFVWYHDKKVDVSLFTKVISLVDKVSVFWVKQDMSCHPDSEINQREWKDEEILSGPSAALHLAFDAIAEIDVETQGDLKSD
jgi:hypothetical protein